VLASVKLLWYLARPKTIFLRRTSNSLGDNLVMSSILPDLRMKYPDHKIVVETPWKELFRNNPYADWVTDRHFMTTDRHIKPRYHVDETTTVSVFEQTARYAGKGRGGAPQIYLSGEEIAQAASRFPGDYITICPVGLQDFFANRKEWGLARFQRLRDLLSDYRFVQIGLPTDPLLDGVSDFRRVGVRETAAAIRNSLFFIGLEGGLMHLTRAVGKRAVIIYGGLLKPEITGYAENLNVYNAAACSPCFHSDYRHEPCASMECMEGIRPEAVHELIRARLRQLQEAGA
jgi:ADP-heptose:LPS heptosyltransferase